MEDKIDLKTIEKNILKTGHQHGLFDMMFGFIITGMAFGPIFRESLPEPYRYFLWPLIIVIIAELSIFIILKLVIQPRTGIAKPGPRLKSIRNKMIIISLIQFILLLIVFILPLMGIGSGIQVSTIIFLLIVGLTFMPMFTIIAYLFKYPRLYVIGVLIWLAIAINELAPHSLDYRIRWIFSFGIIGSVIFITGLVIFIRFLKKYPIPNDESD
jgi:MFS family permease